MNDNGNQWFFFLSFVWFFACLWFFLFGFVFFLILLETSIFTRKEPEKFKIKQLFGLLDGKSVMDYTSTGFEYIRWKRIPARTPKAHLLNSTFLLWGFIVWLSYVCFHFSSVRSRVEFVGTEAYFKQKLNEEKTAFPGCLRKTEGMPLCYCGIWVKMEYCSGEDSFQGIP